MKDELLEPLYLEFVNRVNEVGVDVNRCLTHSHTASLIQFVCGLGPRKGYHLLKVRLSAVLQHFTAWWITGLLVRVSDSQLHSCEFDSRLPRCGVTTCGKLVTNRVAVI